jgi:hypothetical protein
MLRLFLISGAFAGVFFLNGTNVPTGDHQRAERCATCVGTPGDGQEWWTSWFQTPDNLPRRQLPSRVCDIVSGASKAIVAQDRVLSPQERIREPHELRPLMHQRRVQSELNAPSRRDMPRRLR